MKVRATEFTVGHALQTDIFLEPDGVFDRAIFHLAQLRGRELPFRGGGASLEQITRPQQAPDMIGAIRQMRS